MRKKNTATVLSFFLGTFGIHKFYLGKILSGVLYLLFCWTLIPTVLGLVEGIFLLKTNEETFFEKYNSIFMKKTVQIENINAYEEINNDLELTKEMGNDDLKNELNGDCSEEEIEETVNYEYIRLNGADGKAYGTINDYKIEIRINQTTYTFNVKDGNISIV